MQCGFEVPGSCPWQLVEGMVMRAGQLGSLSMDAAGSQQGTVITTMTISSVAMTMSLLVSRIQLPCTTLFPQKCVLVDHYKITDLR